MGSLRRFCQYFEICNFSYWRNLAVTDFNKKRDSTKVLQLLRNEAIFKKIYRRKREKFTVN